MKKVTKFGGTSLASSGQVKKVADIIKADKSRKYVVVSAPGKRKGSDDKVTDLLYQTYDAASTGRSYKKTWENIKSRYEEIIDGLKLNLNLDFEFASIEENFVKGIGRDYAASRGEYLNALVISEYLGFKFVDAADIIVFNDNGTLNEKETYTRAGETLEHIDYAVIPGFYGAKEDGTIVTFSRGGSDITGSLIARGVMADEYENWTDVSGVLVADPRIVKDPEVIDTITYEELRELSYMGATVLHEDAIFPVRKEGIPIRICNTDRPQDPGTSIVESTCKSSRFLITGIAGKKGFCSITIDKAMMNSEIGFCERVLRVFADNGISIEHMPSGIDTMSVFVHQSEFEMHEQKVIAGIHRAVSPDRIEMESEIALIAVVGRSMRSARGTAGRVFSALAHAGVNIRMIDQGSSERNIIIGVKDADFEAAIKAIYAIFVETKL